MVGNNIYFNDYLAGYISLKSIPYKYWDNEVVAYAIKKDPYAYYEMLLEYTLANMTGMTVEECLAKTPKQYKTPRIYKKLLDADYTKYSVLVPKEMQDQIKLTPNNQLDLVKNFKYIEEKYRTPALYKELSRISFEDYLMYVVNYHDIPDIYRKKDMCVNLFFSNIDKYLNEIPDEYKSIELAETLLKIDFNKYFFKLPEACRTKAMYEKLVTIDPAKYIDLVPQDKRTQKMYDMLFDYTMDTYLDKIPKDFRTKEMYHRLIRINPNKYFYITPRNCLDSDIANYLIKHNPKYFELLPDEIKTPQLYLNLIKMDPQKYLKYLPVKYYTPEIIEKVSEIIIARNLTHKLNGGNELNSIIIDKYPILLGKFTASAIHDFITTKLIQTMHEHGDIADIVSKYHLKNAQLTGIMNNIKKENPILYNELTLYLNNYNANDKYTIINENIDKLERIVLSLGQITRRKMTQNQKLQIAYLTKKYLNYSLEELYAYNNSNRNNKPSSIVNTFIEYILDYSLYVDTYRGTIDLKKISYNNEWLKDFDFYKFFDIRNGIAHTKYIYGKNKTEMSLDTAEKIIKLLIAEEIPLNLLIVNNAFRRYYMGELDNYIKELHSLDNIFNEVKRKKR